MKDKSYDDRLAELEAVILKYYLNRGYKLEKDQINGDTKWEFYISISTLYKQKHLEVRFLENEKYPSKIIFQSIKETTKEMFDDGIERFTKADVV